MQLGSTERRGYDWNPLTGETVLKPTERKGVTQTDREKGEGRHDSGAHRGGGGVTETHGRGGGSCVTSTGTS